MGSRLFAAVLPPQTMIDEIEEFVAPRRDSDDRLRWTKPAGWHLTTAFMEPVEESRVEPLIDALSESAARTAVFQIRLAGTRCFPEVWRARVLALGVSAGESELAELAARCRSAANRSGVPVDGSRFVGHLTLVRSRRPFDATKWLRVIDSFLGVEWQAGELALVESHLSDPGHRYEVLARLPLGRP